ncbi:FliH/SctL family protein [Sphingomonas sp.]|jgi:flagellar assembly protein FliH|uniref:FliH/SctL family protein n=1 Tax=Sphingomonas sp. TaxID=28214 RepID=UPI002ED93AF2
MASSLHIKPFAFDQVFDAGDITLDDASIDDWRVRASSLEAELASAQKRFDEELARARADGFEAGLAYARTEREEALLSATDALHATMETMEASLDAITDEAAREAAVVAHAAAELLAARALAHAPGAAIDAAIGRVLRQVARGQEVQITVAPALVDEMERLIAVRQSADRRRLALTVTADPALPIGDAHIHWEQGGLVLDAAARAATVRASLAAVLPQ